MKTIKILRGLLSVAIGIMIFQGSQRITAQSISTNSDQQIVYVRQATNTNSELIELSNTKRVITQFDTTQECIAVSPSGVYLARSTYSGTDITVHRVDNGVTIAVIPWRSEWQPCQFIWYRETILGISNIDAFSRGADFEFATGNAIELTQLPLIPFQPPVLPEIYALPNGYEFSLQYHETDRFMYVRCFGQQISANLQICPGGTSGVVYDVATQTNVATLERVASDVSGFDIIYGRRVSRPAVAWSADGRYIAYRSVPINRYDWFDLAVFDLQTNSYLEFDSLNEQPDYWAGLQWSTAGHKLLLWVIGRYGEDQAGDSQQNTRHAVLYDMTNSQIIAADRPYEYQSERLMPDSIWSPDGRALVFLTGAGDMVQMDAISGLTTILDTQVQDIISWRTTPQTATPTATASATPTNTPAPTATETATHTSTPVAATATASATPTDTPAPTATETATHTATPVEATATASATPTDTPAPTATETPLPTATPTPADATATASTTLTDTPLPTATETPLPTATATPTDTPIPDTPTPIPPSATPLPSPTPTPTPSGVTSWERIEAESFVEAAPGVFTANTYDPQGGGGEVRDFDAGRWLRFDNVNLGAGVTRWRLRADSPNSGTLSLRVGSEGAAPFCTLSWAGGSVYNTQTTTCSGSGSASGTVSLFLRNDSVQWINTNWFELEIGGVWYRIETEWFNAAASGAYEAPTYDGQGGALEVRDFDANRWLRFDNVNLLNGVVRFRLRADSPHSGSLSLRIGSPTATPFCTLSWTGVQVYSSQEVACSVPNSGIQTVYLTNDSVQWINVNWFMIERRG